MNILSGRMLELELDFERLLSVLKVAAGGFEPPNVLRRENWVGKNVGYLLEKSIQYLHYRRSSFNSPIKV